MLKKKIGVLLVIAILFMPWNGLSFGLNKLDEYSKSNLSASAILDLQSLAKTATTDDEATAVYNELIKRAQKNEILASQVIDTYLTHYSTTVNGKSIDIHYKLKARVPSGAALSLGYEYPAVTRTSGSSISLSGKNA